MPRQAPNRRWAMLAWTIACIVVLTTPRVAGSIDNAEVPAEALEVSAILTAQREAVLSAENAGLILEVTCDMGQRFAADDPLVVFDDRKAQAEAAIARAELTAARAEQAQVARLAEQRSRERNAEAVLTAAQAQLAATKRLHTARQASQMDLAKAERDVITAQTDLELVAITAAQEKSRAARAVDIAAARAQLAEQTLSACRVPAPYAGRVAHVMIHPHERVEPGTPLLKIVDDTVLRAKCLLPSEWFAAIAIGDAVTLRVKETNTEVRGQVSHVAAVLDPASRTFELFATVDNAAGTLRAGMNATLVVTAQHAR
jgi:multidrug resistance efflux pump